MFRRIFFQILVVLLIAFSVLLTMALLFKGKFSKHSESQPLFGTTVSVDVCYEPSQKAKLPAAMAHVWKTLEEIHWRMNVFDEKSDVTKINNAAPKAVPVDPMTYQVLKESVHFSQVTHGAFDITVRPLMELWKTAASENRLPTTAELKKIKKVIGSRQIQLLNHHSVRLRRRGVKIDLGGIAAGFALDEAVKILRDFGFSNFLIDAGGDMYAGGYNCHGRPWRIGVQDPRDRRKLVDVVELTDAAISTSGQYEQYFEIQGERWSHIINPLTGYPQQEVVSATVIAPRGIDVDAVATALCVFEPVQGILFMDALGEKWASIVFTKEGNEELRRFQSQNYPRVRLKSFTFFPR